MHLVPLATAIALAFVGSDALTYPPSRWEALRERLEASPPGPPSNSHHGPPPPPAPKPTPATKSPTPKPPATTPSTQFIDNITTPAIPTFDRPRIVLNGSYWSTFNCSANACQTTYDKCVRLFGGDGCSCYPGLLKCARSNCLAQYSDVLSECYSHQPKDTRCALECAPNYYPFVESSSDTIVAPLNSTNDTSSTIQAPILIDWTVVATLTIQKLNSSEFDDVAYDFIDTLVGFLQPNETSLVANNISYQVIDRNQTTNYFVEVNLIVSCGSLDAMNRTDRLLEYLLFGTTKDVSAFGNKLVDAGILFNATQFDVQSVKTQVHVYAQETYNQSNSPNSTVPRSTPAQSTTFGLPPGVFIAVTAGGAALVALFIACLCLKCRKKSVAPPSPRKSANVQA